MEGGFNDVSVAMARGASRPTSSPASIGCSRPYGGLGAIPRSLQISAWTLENELRQLQTFGFITPAIFLGVAAFILNVALARALSLQRSQIAALKALGYSNRETGLALHQMGPRDRRLGRARRGRRPAPGSARALIGLYNEFFRFPALDFTVVIGAGDCPSSFRSLAVAARRRAVGRAPRGADSAGRSDAAGAAGPDIAAACVERAWRRFRMTPSTRMILRNLERQPSGRRCPSSASPSPSPCCSSAWRSSTSWTC